jgi:hypothetical protein
MNYIITKQTPRNEWRIYLDDESYDGKVIYKGHKLGIDTITLMEFLEYRQERSTGKVLFLDYEKVEDTPDHKVQEQWIVGTSNNIESILEKSWESLLNMLKEKKGNFRKISITKVNI